MKRLNKNLLLKTGVAVTVACAMPIAYMAIWGRLTPLVPWVVGFEYQDTGLARLYSHAGTDLSPFRPIDAIIRQVEDAHQMQFTRRVEIFVCASDAEHARLAGTRARFRSIPPYGRLYVSKRAQQDAAENKIHLNVYLRHELSHSLLTQNMSLMGILRCPDWLLEGLAVLSAEQMGVDGYLTKGEVQETIRQGHFLSPYDFVPNKPWRTSKAYKAFDVPNKYWFLYSEMACFVQDLLETHGKERFRSLLDGFLRGASETANFQNVYGEPIDQCIEAFRNRMSDNHPPVVLQK